MTKVITRYGCDGGCGRYFENKDDLNTVAVQQLRGLNNGETISMTDRYEWWCQPCTDERKRRERSYEYRGPSRTTPGFKIGG